MREDIALRLPFRISAEATGAPPLASTQHFCIGIGIGTFASATHRTPLRPTMP
jgi:hypothetical protein